MRINLRLFGLKSTKTQKDLRSGIEKMEARKRMMEVRNGQRDDGRGGRPKPEKKVISMSLTTQKLV
jgi:hypothetical protein